VGKLSIVARGHAGGFTWYVPEGDSLSVTRSQLLDRIAAMMGGRVAEQIVTGEFSSGSQSDLEQAGTLARKMVADFGMSTRLGPYIVKPFSNGYQGEMGVGYSERIASEIDNEVQAILAEAEARASEVLTLNRSVLDQVAHALMEQESLEGDALDDLLLTTKSPDVKPSVPTPGS
jgi:cell division protease FtsH